MKIYKSLIVLPLFALGCASLQKDYVSADRATYEALVPYYEEKVNNDPDLRDWEKDLKLAVSESWLERLQEAESGRD